MATTARLVRLNSLTGLARTIRLYKPVRYKPFPYEPFPYKTFQYEASIYLTGQYRPSSKPRVDAS